MQTYERTNNGKQLQLVLEVWMLSWIAFGQLFIITGVKVFGLELTVSQAGQALGAVSLACLSLLFSSMRR